MIGVSCKCITYGRVEYLEESLFSFLNQKYEGPSELLIVNDYPLQKLHFDHPNVRIINLDKTFNTIGEKENFAVSSCKYDTIAVWDDDDMALPNHLSNINKFFPGHDLLHWNKGIFLHSNQIRAIRSVGNSGIVYSKKKWKEIGGHPLENAGYDMSFVRKIEKSKGKICRAMPKDEEASWIYTWGGGSYHMSGQGKDTPKRENVIVRHSRHIETLRERGKIPTGDIELKPKWKHDYKKMHSKFIEDTRAGKPVIIKKNLNGWSIGEELFDWLVNNIKPGSTILEFGSGRGTIEIAKYFKVYSVECNPRWVGLTKDANYILSPMVDRWYDINPIMKELNGTDYKAIIIDGPNIRDGDREGFIKNIKHFNTKKATILIDDTNRAYEHEFSKRVSKAVGRKNLTIKGFEKSFDII